MRNRANTAILLSWSFGILAPLALAGFSCAETARAAETVPEPPVESELSVDARIRELLAPYATRSELSHATGTSPYRCVLAGPGMELCSWHVGNRSAMWQSLASALDTRRAVNIICELPIDRTARASSSCVVRPREKSGSLESARSKGSAEPALLAAAGTVTEISFLIGEVPWDCSYIGNRERTCVWKSTSRTHGHELLGSMIGSTKKLRLSCVVPRDGSRRQRGSCLAEVGS